MTFDKRVTPARADVAARRLEGQVTAERFVDPVPMQVSAAVASMRRSPAHDGPQETQLLFGESIDIYDEADGWGWGQASLDGYVGYVDMDALSAPILAPTHRVTALRTYMFSKPDIKSAPLRLISMNAKLTVVEAAERFVKVARGGYVFRDHAASLGSIAADPAGVAEQFLGAPYFWGGRESLGLDCSALIQNALERCGVPCPRDADMQEAALGAPVDISKGLKRGDLVFWKGHVGIMCNETEFLHANATYMCVTRNNLKEFAAQVEAEAGPITSARRLP